MKKFTVIITTVLITLLNAAYLENIPILVKQPDGSDINCFSTGDEFFNRLHDKDNYTIIQGNDGWYYYGTRKGDDVVPSPYRVGEADPGETGLEKGAKISENLYRSRVLSFNDYDRPKGKDAPTTGVINNIVIFIRFADEEESIFNSQRSYYDEFFNKPEGPSLGHYFNEVSYQQLDVISHYYPHVEDFSTNLSYQDINPRGYYQPYNETSNPIGYSGGDNGSERTEREHSLLERAVLAVKDQIPTDINIDSDGDGYVDNIVFLISGAPGSWASLLWPHRWALYTRDITINRKRVFDYNFNMTGTTNYFTVGVISHEFFHTLGAPDLYHYYDDTAPDAVGPWDIMNRTSDPPQYMGAWMKYKYGHWIDAPVTIDQPGEYTLQPLQSQTGNMFMIPSPNSLGEFFLVEYRKQSGLYETGLPGDEDGMLIYRIDASYDGNAQGPPDEVYIFRPGGTVTSNGILNNAQFSSGTERTEFNFSTDPYPFLSDGGEGGINITNIGTAGETITFSLGLNVLGPKDVTASINYEGIELNWNEPDSLKEKEISHYILYRDGGLLTEEVYQTTFTDISVEPGNTYSYSVAAYYTGIVEGESPLTSADDITFSPPQNMPYTTGFSDTDEWSQINVNCTSRFSQSNSSNAGGVSPEIMAEYENIYPGTARFVSPPVSTTGTDTLKISFKHFYDGYEPGVDYKIQISPNRFDWHETEWSFAGTETDVGPETAEILLTDFFDPVYVSWTLEGNLWIYDGWYIDDVNISPKNPDSVQDNIIPSSTVLYGNYPNPFNPETTISFDLDTGSSVSLKIYNSRGTLVRTLIEGDRRAAGSYSIKWDGSNSSGQSLSSGVYYIMLSADGKMFTHKSLMIK